jgi:hypothetical protein
MNASLRPAAAGNAVSVVGVTKFHGDPWATYDALPAAVRLALQQHNLNVCSHHTNQRWRDVERAARRAQADGYLVLRDELVSMFVSAVEQSELAEIDLYAEQFTRAYSTPYPHVAAQASILRGGSTKSRSRNGRRCRSLYPALKR